MSQAGQGLVEWAFWDTPGFRKRMKNYFID